MNDHATPAVMAYETRLSLDSRWALYESSRHFEEKSLVFEALRKIAGTLDGMRVPYAVVGGMALFRHGYRRYTEEVNILVSRLDLKKFHDNLDGLGYRPTHGRSKHFRDTELGVRIEFLTVGEYPGDGREKPVAFPPPESASVDFDGVRYLDLPHLVELKLASGMTNPGRMRDLSDVMELMKLRGLPFAFGDQLNPYVRAKYAELWAQGRTRFVTEWRDDRVASEARSIEDLISSLKTAAETLEAMRRDGVTLERLGREGDGRARLVTTDPEVARKYEMVEEFEYWDGGAEAGPEDASDP